MLYEVLLNFLRFQSQVNREILLIKLNIEIEWGFVLFHFKNTAKKWNSQANHKQIKTALKNLSVCSNNTKTTEMFVVIINMQYLFFFK